jgi:hypothetical protein
MAMAVASPMPLLAPVIRTIRSFNEDTMNLRTWSPQGWDIRHPGAYIIDLSKWTSFRGFGPLPGIAKASLPEGQHRMGPKWTGT